MRILTFIILVTFLQWANAGTDYPPVPHPELYDQLWVAPTETLARVREMYQRGQQQQNTELQLDALLLMVYGYDGLEKQAAFDSALTKGIDLATRTDSPQHLAYFYSRKAYNLNKQGHPRQALQLSAKAISIARKLGDNRMLGESLADRGLILTEQGQEEAALLDLLAAHQIFDRYKDQDNLTILYSHIGNVYFNLGNYAKAIEFHRKSAESLKPDELRDIAIVQLNIGAAYTLAENYGEAQIHLAEAREIFKNEGIIASLGLTNYWFGALNAQQQNYQDAITHYQQALELFTKEQNVSMQFNCHTKLANIQIKLDQPDSAQLNLSAAQNLLSRFDSSSGRLMLSRIEGKLAARKKDYAAAYAASQTEIKLLEEFNSRASNSKLQQLQVQFESNQKAAENSLLKEKNKVQELKIISNRAQHNFALTIGAMVLVLLLLTFFGFLQQRHMYKKMAALAMIDELTGASNRRKILIRTRDEIDRARRYQGPLSLAMVDMDHFKDINDHYGHDVGDEVLKIFVSTAKRIIRTQDEIGRLGGEEWLLIFPNTSPREAGHIIDRIRQGYRTAQIDGIVDSHEFTFSAGITDYRHSDHKPEELLVRADQGMYQAKQAGRDTSILV